MTSEAAAVSRWLNDLPARLACDENVTVFGPDPRPGAEGWLGLDCRTERGGYSFWISITGYFGPELGTAQVIVGQYE
jgi:hypothetical protein